MKAEALVYNETGKPLDVLSLQEIDVPAPQTGEVTIALERAVVHPSDMGMIGGTYGRLRALPAVAGREGVGRIAAVGGNAAGLSVGDRVRMPEDAGVWRAAITVPASEVEKVPSDIPAELAAMAFINPMTVWRILHDFVELKPGDWVLQNAGSSALGQCLVQIARGLGLRTVSVVRNVEKWEPLLKALGADAVLPEEKDSIKRIVEIVGGKGNLPKLALNSIGGESAARLTRMVGFAGTIVTFGGMTGDLIRFPTREFIFNDLRLRGFWMDRWNRSATPEARAETAEKIFAMMRAGTLKMAVDAVYPLREYKAAIARALEGGRNGKVQFTA
ncbi:MAG TPA: 2-enoyl thioester reductase domain-containing protein [Candidatus Spyradosoma merdigallinarum]|uniref:enoyl-[acyl-carrier-protein] reductase n=1 Tax=Candidatus Spyradosoma merdigallinarum TaxID=2840950 RepID=A0A9D1T143_9BACT|nr:2-enoyl thioester reductase domain-containing protein [Candidatus Spyradosoma merdigallinarum]